MTVKFFSCVFLFLWSFNSGAEDVALGRLFFDEHERREISQRFEQARLHPEQVIKEEDKPVVPLNITLNGLIIRSSGKNTVWIDDKQNPQQEGLYGLQIDIEHLSLNQTGVPILIHSGDIQVYLKPGQKMNTTNGAVSEIYEAEVANDS